MQPLARSFPAVKRAIVVEITVAPTPLPLSPGILMSLQQKPIAHTADLMKQFGYAPHPHHIKSPGCHELSLMP